MSDVIRIRIADVERIRGALDQAEREIKQALARVDQALKSAEWQDSNRRRFEDRWKATRAATDLELRARELRTDLNQVIAKAKALGGS